MRRNLAAATIALSAFMTWPALARTQAGWMELGGSATGAGVSASPATFSTQCDVAVDASGNPTIVWVEPAVPTGNGNCVYLRQWSGTAWVELAGSASGGGLSGPIRFLFPTPKVRIDNAGHPVVTWLQGLFVWGEVFLKKWTGTAWVELAGSGSGNGVSQSGVQAASHDLALDGTGNPVVAWTVLGTASNVYVRLWKDGAWTGLGGSFTPGIDSRFGAARPSVKVDSSGQPWVAWTDLSFLLSDIHMRRWDTLSGSWIEVGGSATDGGISKTGGTSDYPSLVLNGANRPTVAWQQSNPVTRINKVYAKAWNGSDWVELNGSASGDGLGLSQDPPALVMRPDDKPVVAFSAGDLTTPGEIRLLQWTGSAWTGISGSEGTEGISATPDDSRMPAIAVEPSGTIAVAWQEGSATDDREILARIHGPLAMTELRQLRADGVTPIAAGDPAWGTGVVLEARVTANTSGVVQVFLDVEAVPVGTPFSGIPTLSSTARASDTLISLPLNDRAIGPWKWQARARNSLGKMMAWVPFGNNPDSQADFLSELPPPPSAGGTGGHAAACSVPATGAGIPIALFLAALAGAALHRR